MAKPTQKSERLGYGLWINRTGDKNDWERQGFLFANPVEAKVYRDKHHPTINKYRITGIRVNVEPVVGIK